MFILLFRTFNSFSDVLYPELGMFSTAASKSFRGIASISSFGDHLHALLSKVEKRARFSASATSLCSRFGPVYFTLPLPPRVLVLHVGVVEGPSG